MIKFTSQLRQEMEQQLEDAYHRHDRDALRSKASFEIVFGTIAQLRAFIREYQFTSTREEILFFKEIKPSFEHLAIYFGELAYLQASRPAGAKDTIIRYLQKAIDSNNDFIQRHSLLYTYYQLGHTEEDERLFVRNGLPASLYPYYNEATDTSFFSQSSELLSKLLAYEKVNDYLIREIEYLETGVAPAAAEQNRLAEETVWTDNVVNLIELAYALHASGAINRGKAKVRQIITVLELAFKVNTGNYYRAFQNIRLRKKNRTSFIDSAREKLIRHMDDTDML